MTSFKQIEKIASSFPEVTVEPHFEKISFRVRNKIFLTYEEQTNKATVKLSIENQDLFSFAQEGIFPVNNKWGKQGWTHLELDKIAEKALHSILISAYCEVAPKKLATDLQANNK